MKFMISLQLLLSTYMRKQIRYSTCISEEQWPWLHWTTMWSVGTFGIVICKQIAEIKILLYKLYLWSIFHSVEQSDRSSEIIVFCDKLICYKIFKLQSRIVIINMYNMAHCKHLYQHEDSSLISHMRYFQFLDIAYWYL